MMSEHMAVLLPCTEKLNTSAMEAARKILLNSTPPNYTLTHHNAVVKYGSHPHRWLGVYSRNDNYYSSGGAYLRSVKEEFLRFKPQGTTLSNVFVNDNGHKSSVQVEFIVNCECKKVAKRRRRNATVPYTKERRTCGGT